MTTTARVRRECDESGSANAASRTMFIAARFASGSAATESRVEPTCLDRTSFSAESAGVGPSRGSNTHPND